MVERETLISMVRGLQNGDEDAATRLYETFQKDIYYFILKTVNNDKDLAEDLTQDTFVEILETIGNLQEPAAFVTWSRQIAYHKCTGYFKKRRELLADEDEDGYSVFDTMEEENEEFIPDAALDHEDLKNTIVGMINDLPQEQKAAILLRYFNEISVQEIAKIQGVSEGTVKSRLNYARKAIKKSVEDYERKNDIRLHCVGVVPLLLWLFRQHRLANQLSLTAPVSAAAMAGFGSAGAGASAAGGAAAAGAGSAAAATAGGTAAAATAGGTALGVKIAAGAAALALLGGAAAVILKPEAPAEVPDEPEVRVMEWMGYDTPGNLSTTYKHYHLMVDEMDDDSIEGSLAVTKGDDMYHITDFSGTGTEDGEGVLYEITFDTPLDLGFGMTHTDSTLYYNEDSDTFTIDDSVYGATLTNRAVIDSAPVLEENISWAGWVDDTYCHDYDLHEHTHWMELTITRRTQYWIEGYFTVYKYGVEEYTTEFQGFGYQWENHFYYDTMLTNIRVYDDGILDTAMEDIDFRIYPEEHRLELLYWNPYSGELVPAEDADALRGDTPELNTDRDLHWVGFEDYKQFDNHDYEYYDLTIDHMDENGIRGNVTVAVNFEEKYNTNFTGVGSVVDGQLLYYITFETPVEVGFSMVFEECPLYYDPATDTFTFDGVFDATLDHISQIRKAPVLESGGSWSGAITDYCCNTFTGEIHDHFIEMQIDHRTAYEIRGRFVVYTDGEAVHSSTFTGIGFPQDENNYYVISLDTTRFYDYDFTDGYTLTHLELLYHEDVLELLYWNHYQGDLTQATDPE